MPFCAAMRWQSSYSGAAFSIVPFKRETFMRISPERRRDRNGFALQHAPAHFMRAHANGGRLAEDQIGQPIQILGLGQQRDQHPGAILFHLHRRRKNIKRARSQRLFGKVAVNLRAHVVEICFDHFHRLIPMAFSVAPAESPISRRITFG